MVQYANGIYKVMGRIDTATVEQFRSELDPAFGQEKAILDFAEVEYISSSGLRVLLSLKKSGTTVEIINAGSTIYDIFETTGFTSLVKISKKMREVRVDGCEIIGRGMTGTIYKIEEDMVIKVYNPSIPLSVAEEEKKFAKNAFILGVPTAIPFDVVKVGECYGTCFELVNAINLGAAFQKYPERYEELIDKYVALAKTIRDIEDTNGMFKNIKDVLRERMKRLDGLLPDAMTDRVKELIDAMPNSHSLVHGDLHTGNVMLQGDDLVIIDMADMTTGPKEYDFMCIYRDLFMTLTNLKFKEMAEKNVSMPAELGLKVWDDFMRRYLDNAAPEKIQNVLRKLELLSAANGFIMSGCLPTETIQHFAPAIAEMYEKVILPNFAAIKSAMAQL